MIGRTFATWWRNAPRFSLLGALAYAPLSAMMYRLYARLPGLAAERRPEAFGPRIMGELGLAWVLSFVLTILLLGAVCQGALESLRGGRARLGAMVAAAFRRSGAILAILLFGLLAFFGTLCTVVVPFLLVTAWIAAIPAALAERLGPIRAMRRSWDLTRGHRWPVFAGYLVVGAGVMAVGIVVQSLTMVVAMAALGAERTGPGGALAVPMAIYQLVGGALSTATIATSAVAYHGLRTMKEGGDPAFLARVFE
ncbi:MAG TPA: glycerophosphoryl diester phosphodiesterase membrane domain-containing protein [Anaeromyxobacter sp.]|nr:glycerophosphoryl diester phosphodiesterase membrane domain-containing protein [Anaeromyxobacter sp.]